jgi:mono/diheme cytochrome c family protein
MMMRGKRILGVLGIVFCLVSFIGASVKADSPVDKSLKNKFTGNAEAIATGKLIFEATCTGYCHSAAGSSRAGRCPNLFDCDWKHGGSDGEVFHAITEGIPKTEMLGFKGKLPDEILWKIIAYLRSASQCQSGGTPAAAASH